MAGYDYSIDIKVIPEIVVDGKRLGRHVRHDHRNRRYPYKRHGVPLKPVLLTRHIPILNQGQVGSCTGNATTGALGTDPLYNALDAKFPGISLDETTAVEIYSAAETIDGDGPYPPQDNGSSGPSACQAALNDGYIGGYVHCFSVGDILDATSVNKPVMMGSNWYDSFDQPNSSGLVTISPNAVVRGGHEWLIRGIDPENKTCFADNSWSEAWGLKGSFLVPWDVLERLLAEQGDGTVPEPLGTVVSPTPVGS